MVGTRIKQAVSGRYTTKVLKVEEVSSYKF